MNILQTIPNRYIWLVTIFLLIGSLLPTSNQAQADPGTDIRIDYGNAGTVGGNWNEILVANFTTVTTGLTDFNTGTATNVSVQGTGGMASSDMGANVWNGGVAEDWLVDNAARDTAQASAPNSTRTVTFSGLTASSYKVEVLSAVPAGGSGTNDITVDGNQASQNFRNNGDGLGIGWDTTTAGVTNRNWLIWDSVVPSGGQIVITIDAPGATDDASINAIRLVGASSSVGGTAELITLSPTSQILHLLAQYKLALVGVGLLLMGIGLLKIKR